MYFFLPFDSSSKTLPPKFIFICSGSTSLSTPTCEFKILFLSNSFSSLAFLFSSLSSALAIIASSLSFCISSLYALFLSSFSSLLSCDFSTKSFINSDVLIPNINTNNIIAIPIHAIIAPIVPNKLTSGTARAAPIAPPPVPDIPILYASFTTSDNSLFIVNSPDDIWNVLINVIMLTKNTPYSIIFDFNISLSSHAIFIAIANIPIGSTYLIIPIIPPRISLNSSPITPDFVYIKTPSNTAKTISITIAKSIFEACFLELALFPVLLFLYVLFLANFLIPSLKSFSFCFTKLFYIISFKKSILFIHILSFFVTTQTKFCRVDLNIDI